MLLSLVINVIVLVVAVAVAVATAAVVVVAEHAVAWFSSCAFAVDLLVAACIFLLRCVFVGVSSVF